MGSSCSRNVPIVERPRAIDEEVCCICMQRMNADDRFLLKCNHAFCKTCISRWMEVGTTCPSCRAAISGIETIATMRTELLSYSILLAALLHGAQHESMKGLLWMAYCVTEPWNEEREFASNDMLKVLIPDAFSNELRDRRADVERHKAALDLISSPGVMYADLIESIKVSVANNGTRETVAKFSCDDLDKTYVDTALSRSFARFMEYAPEYVDDPVFELLKGEDDIRVLAKKMKGKAAQLNAMTDAAEFMGALKSLIPQ